MLKIIHPLSMRTENCPLGREVKSFNAANYQLGRNVVYLNVQEAITETTDTSSRNNETYTIHALNLADQLITSLPQETIIAYLTCYEAECRAAQSGRDKMIRQNSEASRLTIATTDSIQGEQYDVVIIDLVVLGNSAGFQGELQRLTASRGSNTML
jgi:hypothetical protein